MPSRGLGGQYIHSSTKQYINDDKCDIGGPFNKSLSLKSMYWILMSSQFYLYSSPQSHASLWAFFNGCLIKDLIALHCYFDIKSLFYSKENMSFISQCFVHMVKSKTNKRHFIKLRGYMPVSICERIAACSIDFLQSETSQQLLNRFAWIPLQPFMATRIFLVPAQHLITCRSNFPLNAQHDDSVIPWSSMEQHQV